MDERQRLDFYSALGEAFCEALTPVVGGEVVVPQDAYEVWVQAFHQPPTPDTLAVLSAWDLDLLHAVCVAYFENDTITVERVRAFVADTRARWPASTR